MCYLAGRAIHRGNGRIGTVGFLSEVTYCSQAFITSSRMKELHTFIQPAHTQPLHTHSSCGTHSAKVLIQSASLLAPFKTAVQAANTTVWYSAGTKGHIAEHCSLQASFYSTHYSEWCRFALAVAPVPGPLTVMAAKPGCD